MQQQAGVDTGRLAQVLSHPRRREILRLVWDREHPAGEIQRAFGDVTFGAISQHLSALSKAGIVRVRREGRHRFYRASQADLEPFRAWLESMWEDALYALKLHAELKQARRGPRPRRRRVSRRSRFDRKEKRT